MREKVETKEVELLLKEWDHLRLVELRLETEGRDHQDWQWSLGMIGNCIREKLMQVGWWSAIDATARSLAKSIPA